MLACQSASPPFVLYFGFPFMVFTAGAATALKFQGYDLPKELSNSREVRDNPSVAEYDSLCSIVAFDRWS